MSKFDKILMETAEVWSRASYCKRNQVGAVIAKDHRIIATGFNGTLPGDENRCEDGDTTRGTVVHAEQNAMIFCAKHGLSTAGSSLYTTVSPCVECAKLIISSGITKVFFQDVYRDETGLVLLSEFGIETRLVKDET